MKKLFITFATIVLFLILVSLGYYGFSKIIYKSCNCKTFNIDNIELRTGINIPEIISAECNYNKSTKTKKASFLMDTKIINLEDYIQKNNLVKSDSVKYIKSNDTKSHSYKVILDKNTGKLDIEIVYKD